MSLNVADLSGNNPFRNIIVGDPKTKPHGRQVYSLATALASLAATTRTSPVYNIDGGSYIFFASFTGTSVQLQYLGDDNVWYNIDAARTTSGSGTAGVVIGEGATVALYNPNGTAVTNINASLS